MTLLGANHTIGFRAQVAHASIAIRHQHRGVRNREDAADPRPLFPRTFHEAGGEGLGELADEGGPIGGIVQIAAKVGRDLSTLSAKV